MISESTEEMAKTGLTLASCINHVRNNRIEYLVVAVLAHSIGALDKAREYAAVCM